MPQLRISRSRDHQRIGGSAGSGTQSRDTGKESGIDIWDDPAVWNPKRNPEDGSLLMESLVIDKETGKIEGEQAEINEKGDKFIGKQ
jgi:hypothetical protein